MDYFSNELTANKIFIYNTNDNNLIDRKNENGKQLIIDKTLNSPDKKKSTTI